ncbi:MAG: hypothetical protein RRC34_08545 [Lentisphaeria bacterium]|nr:hypothetical protein [Lentisphaeria bacterium]
MSGWYKMINLVLIAGAAAATLWLARALGGAELRGDGLIPEPTGRSNVETGAEDRPSDISPDQEGHAKRLPLDDDQVKTLWEKNVFSPTRSEGVNIENGRADGERGNAEMELIGVGSVGGESAAVILFHKKGGRGEGSGRHVYKPGDMIADTGYTLDKVSLYEAVLTKGADERVLRIETADARSQRRSSDAVRAEAEKAPPPPVVQAPDKKEEASGGAETSAAATTAAEAAEVERRERIKKALEARAKIMELRRQKAQQTGDGQ